MSPKAILLLLALAPLASAVTPAPSARPSLVKRTAVGAAAGPSGGRALARSAVPTTAVRGGAAGGFDFSLLCYFAFWYIGNVFYNQYNKMALDAVGGKKSGLTMTISTMQLGICTLYPLLLWLARWNPVKLLALQMPEKMNLPEITKADLIATLPVGFCAACAHSAGVFCLGADPLFGQIVKAGEPVLSALVNTVFYGKPPSIAKAFCLIPIVGGVAFASLKKNEAGAYKLKFDPTALYFGMIGNAFAAFKGSENKKLMNAPGIKERYAGVANQYAVTEILAFLVSLPVMFLVEGSKFGEFCRLLMTSAKLQTGLLVSGMAFYLYNELATMTIKKTGPVTASVANTAKRVIVMVYMSAITGKQLTTEQKIGATIAIGGVMVYSIIDDMLKKLLKK